MGKQCNKPIFKSFFNATSFSKNVLNKNVSVKPEIQRSQPNRFFWILQQCECVYCPDLMMLGHTGNYKSAQGNGIRTCQALHPHGPPLDHGPRGNT